MTKRYLLLPLLAIVIMGSLIGCNKSDDDYDDDGAYTTATMYSSTAITAFNLKANTKVLDSLDKVFFTIDLINAKIFNADSLPYGTKISKLLTNISTTSSSKIEIIMKGEGAEKDSTITYTSTSVDSIDFNRKVIIRVTSLNETYKRDYDVNVNVHKVKADSMTWSRLGWASLPGEIERQKTIESDDKIYTFITTVNGEHRVWVQPSPGASGDISDVNFGFVPALRSLAVADGTFYILSDDGELYSSTDGMRWSSTGEQWHHIYGAYTSYIIGVKEVDGSYYHVSYPATSSQKVDAECPIEGTSSFVSFDSKWSQAPQVSFIGGKKADGTLSNATWSFDGTNWAEISETPIGTEIENATLFTYFSYRSSPRVSWKVTKYTTLFAVGGRKSNGTLNRVIYISRDLGINWKKADDMLQLPDFVSPGMNADAIIASTVEHSRGAASSLNWNEVASVKLPWWWSIDEESPASRATAPITSWEAPYIYLYGGENASGVSYNQIWRGIINRLMFKPLQ